VGLAATHPNVLASTFRSSGAWPDLPLGVLFERNVERCGDRVALVDGERRLTFPELFDLVERTATGLRSLGVRPGDCVAYQLPNWWEAVVFFLAGVRLGAAVNPLLPIFREAELRFMLRQSQASVLVIPGLYRGCDHRALIASLRADLPALRHLVVARDTAGTDAHELADLLTQTPDACPELSRRARRPMPDESAEKVDPNSIALLMYTSGTTATPKGVLHTHNSLAAEVLSLQRVHDLRADDRTLMPSPLTHISGVIHGILAPALLGTSAVLMERWEPQTAIELIERERVTYMVGAPTFLQELLAHPHPRSPSPTRGEGGTDSTPELSSLRLFSCGGASVSPALVQRARALLPACVTKRVYGSTEFPTLTTTSADDALTRGIDSEGRAILPAEVRIADDDESPLPCGAEGEVQARGPECFAGYIDAALNDDSFTSDGWFRSGDLGVIDSAGYLRITGRLKDIIIRKGEKISAREVEEAIAAHPSVAEVAVVALPDSITGERTCAAVRLRSGHQLDLTKLQEFLDTKQLARQKWPEELHVVDEFPRTESGKIIRAQLRERLYQPEKGRRFTVTP
jgi:cyclohexanecarboxylate-CoA ligase